MSVLTLILKSFCSMLSDISIDQTNVRLMVMVTCRLYVPSTNPYKNADITRTEYWNIDEDAWTQIDITLNDV